MPEVFKTPRAEADLKEIWRYTYKRWGEWQANRYLLQLDDGLALLADNPQLGKPRDAILAGYRSLQINRHVVYYRIEGQRIEIVRVLHERMDPGHHFDPES